MPQVPGSKDALLFTPGPLTTSRTVKQAMLRDLGSRDDAFIDVVRRIRRSLLALAEAPEDAYAAILMQGSGTFAVESVFSTVTPPDGRVLLLINGAYGKRMAAICRTLKIETIIFETAENGLPDAGAVSKMLERERVSLVAMVHCETTTGILNPIRQVGAAAHAAGAQFMVDAMSSFGAVPIHIPSAHIDYLVSSANKCIEGVPGFGFAIARKQALLAAEGWARSVSLDLLDQWRGLESNGQFRFTPPTHVLLAFDQALAELMEEGGVRGRSERYYENHRTLLEGMKAMGFSAYLPEELQGHIITAFRYPDHPRWSFEAFYRRLNERGLVIYPGKVSNADCFRIGHIGRIFPADVRCLLSAIRDSLTEMGVSLHS